MSVAEEAVRRRGERLRLLTQTGPETDMGKLLRTFWHPVAVASRVAPGAAIPIRAFSEDLTLYRGTTGTPHLVAARCAHRCTVLHTGWVEGDEIRCMYHGWKYAGTGQCTERPAEHDAGLPKVKIAGYPVREYAGLIFAYLGPEPAPSFELCRKAVCERPGGLNFARVETWKCNWFQAVENGMDAVHVSFVHQIGRVGAFGKVVTGAIPELEYLETEAGIRQIATRGPGNVRISDWTFPNNNHISLPGPNPDDPWIDVCSWKVPVDDEWTARFHVWSVPQTDPETERRMLAYFERTGAYDPGAHHDELFFERTYPADPVFELTSAQDYVAQLGQGTIVDRSVETLGRSDAGIALLRRIFFREMDALREGRPAKAWRKLEQPVELPIQVG